MIDAGKQLHNCDARWRQSYQSYRVISRLGLATGIIRDRDRR